MSKTERPTALSFRLEHQAFFRTLRNPVCIGLFHNDGLGASEATEEADKLREILNEAGIKFAAENAYPPIRISIEKEDLPSLEGLDLAGFSDHGKGSKPNKLPIVVDFR